MLQAVGVRRASAAGQGVMGAARQPLYLAGLGSDFAGWLLSLVALRRLPVFAVQALLAGSLAWAVVLDGLVLKAKARRADAWAVAAVVVTLSLLGAAAGPDRAKPVSGAVEAGLFAGVVAAAAAAVMAIRRRSAMVTAAVSGLGFGGAAVVARALEARSGVLGFLHQPLSLALLGYAVLGLTVYAYALEHGEVGRVTAAMWVSDIVVAGVVGVALLGDRARPGWWWVAVLGTAGAVAAIVVLARSPAQATPIGLEADQAPPPPEPPRPWHRRRPGRRARWVIQAVVAGGAVALALYALGGRREELEGAAAALHHLRWPWLAVAGSAEVASIVAYAAFEGRLLASGGVAVGMPSLTGIAFASYAIQNSLPGGPAWAALFAFRQFRRRGADTVTASWIMLMVPILSAACLGALAVMGIVLAQPQASSLGLVGDVAGVTVGALLLVLGLRRALTSGALASAAVKVVQAYERLARRPRRDPQALVRSTRERLGAVSPRGRDWVVAAGWAVTNWSLDCLCLMLAFFALAAPVPWRGLLLAYGAGQLAANLPITPGGLGAVEGSLTVALVFYGGGRVSTVAAVLLYRIISFWAVLPLGWAAWAALRWTARAEPEVAAS